MNRVNLAPHITTAFHISGCCVNSTPISSPPFDPPTIPSLREDVNLTLSSSLSDLKDLDYAQAISTLNQQMVGLQAAQQAYSRIGQMSLFDYLR